MYIKLDAKTMEYIVELAKERDRLKRERIGPNNWMVSNIDPLTLRIMTVASEWAAAVGLGCMFNPYFSLLGDGDRQDLTCGDIDISLKSRNYYCKPDFIIPPNAQHQDFLDRYGVVGTFTDKTYSVLHLRGWFNKEDWDFKKQTIMVGGTRNGVQNTRLAICAEHLRPIGELADYLDTQVDERVVTAQAEGYLAYFRAREDELRAASEAAGIARIRDQKKPGSKCEASIGERIRAKHPALRGSSEQD